MKRSKGEDREGTMSQYLIILKKKMFVIKDSLFFIFHFSKHLPKMLKSVHVRK